MRGSKLTGEEYLAAAHALALIRNALGVKSSGDLLDVIESVGFPRLDGVEELVRYSLTLTPSPGYVKRLQCMFPRSVGRRDRKVLAMYPTGEKGVKTIVELLSRSGIAGGKATVADPFMGTGVLLTAYTEAFGDVKSVWGIEVHPVAALIGYSLLLHHIPDPDRVVVKIADAFEEVLSRSFPSTYHISGNFAYKADIVLSNPPFTRWELLDPGYRSLLLELFMDTEYSRYITRTQLNLGLLGVFILDAVLNRKGLLISVVPASLFYTVTGRAVKRLLLEKYSGLTVAKGSPSFSDDSGFVELIIGGIKDGDAGESAKEIRAIEDVGRTVVLRVDRESLLDLNWMLLFHDRALELMKKFVEYRENGALVRLEDLVGRGQVVRGVEMYGPDFFIIPNRHWKITGTYDSYISVGNGDLELEIPREYLVKTLRSPGVYKDAAVVEPSHLFLSIPPTDLDKLPRGLRKYIDYGIRAGTTAPALKFGKYWYSHVYRQLRTKRPYGKLFLPDKVAPNEFRAFMTKEIATATKNFYIIKTLDEKTLDLLFAWFNSSMFKQVFKATGRYVSDNWTRYVEEDYLKAPVPPNLEALREILAGLAL